VFAATFAIPLRAQTMSDVDVPEALNPFTRHSMV